MRFGAALDVRFEQTVPQFVDRLAGLGLDHVELRQGYLDTHPAAPLPRELRRLGDERDVTYTAHAPFRGVNLASVHEPLRRAAVGVVTDALDRALAAGAGGVTVHAGSVPARYPDRVHERAREQAVRSVRACAQHADSIGVHCCVENQRQKASQVRFTETPERLAGFLDAVDVDTPYLGVTVDVGHAKVTGVAPEAFADRFGDRVRIAHLHDNDGDHDSHEPLPDFRAVAERLGAPYNVLEMKSITDIERCVRE